jgi:tetratricopeptide (TPR) repeat protein
LQDFGRASRRGPAVLVFGAALLAYSGNLENGFVYDDRFVIDKNPLVQSLDWRGLLTTSYWGEIVDAGLYRPLTLLSFGLNRALGASAFGFHLANDLLHGVAAVLALLVARTLGLSSAGTLAAALLFALHPAQSEPVNALVGRAEILAFAFTLVSFLLFVRKASPLLVGASFLCALLSKESAAFALPLFVLSSAIVPRGPTPAASAFSAHSRRARSARAGCGASFSAPCFRLDRARILALGGAVVAGVVLRIAVLGGLGISGREIGFLDNPVAHSGLGTRVLSAPVLLLHYVRLVLWPRTLSADYSFDQIPLPESATDPRVLLGAFVLTILLYVAARGGRFRVAAFAFVVPLAGSLHLLFPLGTIFAERLLYLPMLGAAFAFGLGIEELSNRRRWVSAAIAVAVLGSCAVRVWTRIPDWRDNETLFRKTVETSPFSARSYFLLGAELLEQKRFSESAESFATGLAIYPSHFGARMSLGEALLAAGDAGAAEQAFGKALELQPASEDARKAAVEAALALGREKARALDFEAARESFERAIALDENEPSAWNYLGLVSEREGRFDEARSHYERALREDPALVEALLNLASLRMHGGELSPAEETYRRAISLAPQSYEAYNGLGIALARQGRNDEAAEAFEKAIAIDPGLETARENLRALTSR